MNKFVTSSLDLLNHNDAKDFVKCKLAGLIIFDCLLDVNDEIMPERRIEITNHIFKVLENDKQPIAINDIILNVASSSVGHFARVASTSEAEFLQNFYFPSAVKLIGNMKSESHRYAGALVFTQLAQNCPALIFSKRKTLFGLLWDVVNDKNATVRTAGALSLQASLHVISQREGLLDYLKSAFRQVDIANRKFYFEVDEGNSSDDSNNSSQSAHSTQIGQSLRRLERWYGRLKDAHGTISHHNHHNTWRHDHPNIKTNEIIGKKERKEIFQYSRWECIFRRRFTSL